MKIESLNNSKVKNWAKLKEKKYRDETNLFLVEGDHLLNSAMLNGSIVEIISTDETMEIPGIPFYLVTDSIMKKLSSQVSSSKVIGVCKKLEEQEIAGHVCLLDNIQDPGNLGTILRTIDSIGLSQVIVSKDTADAFNPKVVRSTMGAIFRVKIIEAENLIDTIKLIKRHHFKLVATSLQTDKSIYDIDFNKKMIVIGNESNGVSKEIQDMADERAKIPMLGKTESLNASVAAGVVMYEYVRQKINNIKTHHK